MKKRLLFALSALLLSSMVIGCASPIPYSYRPVETKGHGWNTLAKDHGLARRILALDPKNITAQDVKNTLSKGPTPWILTVAPLYPWSEEFLNAVNFLIAMGYPANRIGDPRIREYKIYWKEDSWVIAGLAAWLYERDGMAPIMIGWSGGAILSMVVLHDLNHSRNTPVKVVNGKTGAIEDRDWIWDPYEGKKRSLYTIKLPFAAVLAGGGLGRIVQDNIWEVNVGLRMVPDSVEEFLGFQAPKDDLGTDAIGSDPKTFIKANEYKPMRNAKVRSIIADQSYEHFNIIHCEQLLQDRAGRKWADSYRPDPGYGLRDYRGTSRFRWIENKQNLFCAELWYGIKKHWALSAQRVARAVLAGKMPARRRNSSRP